MSVEQLVYAWARRGLTGKTGFSPVATSAGWGPVVPADLADLVGGPVAQGLADAALANDPPVHSVDLRATPRGLALAVKHLTGHDSGGRSGPYVAHVLLDPDGELDVEDALSRAVAGDLRTSWSPDEPPDPALPDLPHPSLPVADDVSAAELEEALALVLHTALNDGHLVVQERFRAGRERALLAAVRLVAPGWRARLTFATHEPAPKTSTVAICFTDDRFNDRSVHGRLRKTWVSAGELAAVLDPLALRAAAVIADERRLLDAEVSAEALGTWLTKPTLAERDPAELTDEEVLVVADSDDRDAWLARTEGRVRAERLVLERLEDLGDVHVDLLLGGLGDEARGRVADRLVDAAAAAATGSTRRQRGFALVESMLARGWVDEVEAPAGLLHHLIVEPVVPVHLGALAVEQSLASRDLTETLGLLARLRATDRGATTDLLALARRRSTLADDRLVDAALASTSPATALAGLDAADLVSLAHSLDVLRKDADTWPLHRSLAAGAVSGRTGIALDALEDVFGRPEPAPEAPTALPGLSAPPTVDKIVIDGLPTDEPLRHQAAYAHEPPARTPPAAPPPPPQQRVPRPPAGPRQVWLWAATLVGCVFLVVVVVLAVSTGGFGG